MTDTMERNPLTLASPLAERFVQGVCDEVSRFDDCYGDSRVEPIETEAYDGFIPYTDGGYDGCVYAQMSYAYGSGSAPATVQADIDRCLKDVESEFAEKHGITVEQMDEEQAQAVELWNQPALPGIDKGDYPQHPLREELYEMQDSYLSEGGTYFYKCRVMFYEPSNYRNDSGDWEVRMFAYLNTDYEYGRDSISWLPALGGKADQTSGDWERTMTAAEFIALGEDGIDDLITDAVKHLANL